MTDFFYWLADAFQVSFRFLEAFKANMNIFFVFAGSVAFLIWLNWQHRLNKQAAENNTFK